MSLGRIHFVIFLFGMKKGEKMRGDWLARHGKNGTGAGWVCWSQINSNRSCGCL